MVLYVQEGHKMDMYLSFAIKMLAAIGIIDIFVGLFALLKLTQIHDDIKEILRWI